LENEILAKLIVELVSVLDGDEGVDGLAGQLVVDADDGCFGDCVVLNQGGFDFGGGETVAGDIDDVVDTASDPVVALVVTASSVTSELGSISKSFIENEQDGLT